MGSPQKTKRTTKHKKLFMDSLLRRATGATLGSTPLGYMDRWQRSCSTKGTIMLSSLSPQCHQGWGFLVSPRWRQRSRTPLSRQAMNSSCLMVAAERPPPCPPPLLPSPCRVKWTPMPPTSMTTMWIRIPTDRRLRLSHLCLSQSPSSGSAKVLPRALPQLSGYDIFTSCCGIATHLGQCHQCGIATHLAHRYQLCKMPSLALPALEKRLH